MMTMKMIFIRFEGLKEMCTIDTKKDPAKKAFKKISDCVQGIAMPLVMKLTDCGQWAGVLCMEGKKTIDKMCDDYMHKWFLDQCVSKYT